MADRFNPSLQENLLTMLAYNDEQGRIIAGLADPTLFEGDYRVIAERVTDYWARFKSAPKVHTPDLFSDILDDPANRRSIFFRHTLAAMFDLSSDRMNADYVIGELRKFTRLQSLKNVILQSAERLNQQQETAIGEVEEMLGNILRTQHMTFDPGIQLHEYDRLIAFLENKDTEFKLGIPEFDDNGIAPAKRTLMLLLAPTNFGKSWMLVHVGRQALLARKKVLHISYEMDAEEVQQRYYQNLFAASKREGEVESTRLEFDGKGQLSGFVFEKVEPEFTFKSQILREELQEHIKDILRSKSHNIFIKQFPPRRQSAHELSAFLDVLESSHRFIPDVLILDSPYLMKTDPKNYRISLGRLVEEIRAIAVERHIAVIGGHQVSREGAEAQFVKSTHVAEDWSVIQTADFILTYSATALERTRGLARLFVAKARAEKANFGVLITQNYALGQFVVGSAKLNDKYWSALEELKSDGEDEGGTNEDED